MPPGEGEIMSLSAEKAALVRVRCEVGAAALIANLGVSISEAEQPVAQLECTTTSELFVEAALRCDVREAPDGLLVADAARYAQRLIDGTPLGDVLDDRGDPCVWIEPEIAYTKLTPMRLGRVRDVEDLHHQAVAWFQQFEAVDPERFSTSMARWRRRVANVHRIAEDRAASALASGATEEERLDLAKALRTLRRHVLYPPSEELDVAFNPVDGEPYLPHRGTLINESLRQVFDVIHRIETNEGERERRDSLLNEAGLPMTIHHDRLPNRIRLAEQADMVRESLGAVRAALLELERPGWTWAPDHLRDAVNPPEEALADLLTVRRSDSRTRLRYEPTGRRTGHYVLVTDFLGREIFRRLSDDASPADGKGGE